MSAAFLRYRRAAHSGCPPGIRGCRGGHGAGVGEDTSYSGCPWARHPGLAQRCSTRIGPTAPRSRFAPSGGDSAPSRVRRPPVEAADSSGIRALGRVRRSCTMPQPPVRLHSSIAGHCRLCSAACNGRHAQRSVSGVPATAGHASRAACGCTAHSSQGSLRSGPERRGPRPGTPDARPFALPLSVLDAGLGLGARGSPRRCPYRRSVRVLYAEAGRHPLL